MVTVHLLCARSFCVPIAIGVLVLGDDFDTKDTHHVAVNGVFDDHPGFLELSSLEFARASDDVS